MLKVQEITNKHVMFSCRKLHSNTRTACLLVTPCTSNLMPKVPSQCVEVCWLNPSPSFVACNGQSLGVRLGHRINGPMSASNGMYDGMYDVYLGVPFLLKT